jgi:hypothetical protein|tara:strand:- start:333 stop:629 length:297 start_codon:yes stop_codon:yes gene_type:complete
MSVSSESVLTLVELVESVVNLIGIEKITSVKIAVNLKSVLLVSRKCRRFLRTVNPILIHGAIPANKLGTMCTQISVGFGKARRGSRGTDCPPNQKIVL